MMYMIMDMHFLKCTGAVKAGSDYIMVSQNNKHNQGKNGYDICLPNTVGKIQAGFIRKGSHNFSEFTQYLDSKCRYFQKTSGSSIGDRCMVIKIGN